MFYSNFTYPNNSAIHEFNQINLAITSADILTNNPNYSFLIDFFGTSNHSIIFTELKQAFSANLSPDLTDALYELLAMSYLFINDYDYANHYIAKIENKKLQQFSLARYYRHNDKCLDLAYQNYKELECQFTEPYQFFLKCETLWRHFCYTESASALEILHTLLDLYKLQQFIDNPIINKHFLMLQESVDTYLHFKAIDHVNEEMKNDLPPNSSSNNEQTFFVSENEILDTLSIDQPTLLKQCVTYLNSNSYSLLETKKLIKEINLQLFEQQLTNASHLAFRHRQRFVKNTIPTDLEMMLIKLRELEQKQTILIDEPNDLVEILNPLFGIDEKETIKFILPTVQTSKVEKITPLDVEPLTKKDSETKVINKVAPLASKTKRKQNTITISEKPISNTFFANQTPAKVSHETKLFQIHSAVGNSEYQNKLHELEKCIVNELNNFVIPALDTESKILDAVVNAKIELNKRINVYLNDLMAEIPSKTGKKHFIKMHKIVSAHLNKMHRLIAEKYKYDDKKNVSFSLFYQLLTGNKQYDYLKKVSKDMDPQLYFDKQCEIAYRIFESADTDWQEISQDNMKILKEIAESCNSYLKENPLYIRAYIYRYFFNRVLFERDTKIDKKQFIEQFKFDMQLVEKLSDSLIDDDKNKLIKNKQFHLKNDFQKEDEASKIRLHQRYTSFYSKNPKTDYTKRLETMVSTIKTSLESFTISVSFNGINSEEFLIKAKRELMHSVNEQLTELMTMIPSDDLEKGYFRNAHSTAYLLLSQAIAKIAQTIQAVNTEQSKMKLQQEFPKLPNLFDENGYEGLINITDIEKKFNTLINYTDIIDPDILHFTQSSYAKWLCEYKMYFTTTNKKELVAIAEKGAQLCTNYIENENPLIYAFYFQRYSFNKILFENEAEVDRVLLIKQLQEDILICEQFSDKYNYAQRKYFDAFKKFHIENDLNNEEATIESNFNL